MPNGETTSSNQHLVNSEETRAEEFALSKSGELEFRKAEIHKPLAQ